MFSSNSRSYRAWRAAKLANYPLHVDELMVQIGGLIGLDSGSVAATIPAVTPPLTGDRFSRSRHTLAFTESTITCVRMTTALPS
jgi:hypothetical protein